MMPKEIDNGFDAQTLEAAAKAVSEATAFLFTAGAGMGVDSGLPDFRGDNGFWKAYPALYGHSFSDMANPEWFEKDPHLAWGFYGHRLNLYRETTPHEGFSILREWGETRPHFIFTSNVDGQFQKAGFSEDQVYECHGSIHWLQHLNPRIKGNEIWSAADTNVDINEETIRAEGTLLRVDGEIVRPNILMFGDWHWLDRRSEKQSDRLSEWLDNTDTSRLVVIETGAGTAIPSVRRFSTRMARDTGTLIRINPRESMGGDLSFSCGAKRALEAIKGVL
jgi:NAD-dependent SIR2 family protein deacetylase